jgi:GalNAc-alpha-(1->4)-GalNAc-alpha-(1->3)-diNAcBac-PP-undecaprenol alpha-1,4-N-acetyl-D-galactosaminyltransferase
LKQNLCLVIPSLHPGGMERVMTELVWYFSKKENIEVHLVLYGIKREIFYDLPTNISIHKPLFEFNNNRRFQSSIKTLAYLRNEFKLIKPTSILSFGELWNNFVLLSSLGLPYSIYVSDRCQPDKSIGRVNNFLRKLLYPKAKGVICQTEKAFQIYSKMFSNSNFAIIGNPIRAINSNEIVQKENIVLSVGRLIKSKHHDDLIRMFAQIQFEDWKLVIVGDDALKQKNMENYIELVKKLNMVGKIILAGKSNDVESYYLKSKIFAFTSSSEGFPNVVGEAMSAGLPVVSYDCIAGPSDLIENEETGYLIKLHDKDAFMSKLSLLMKDESLRINMASKAIESIKKFSSDKISSKFEEFIINENFTN